MKFGKLLQNHAEEMPDTVFLRYKQMKKQLKNLKKADAHGDSGIAEDTSTAEEAGFVDILNEDMKKFNQFFMDKEEDAIIKLQALTEEVSRLKTSSDVSRLQRVQAELINFHGEMVLLLHWSILNFSAVKKIIKKHDKCARHALKDRVLQSLLNQPFVSTQNLNTLVKLVESQVQEVFELTSALDTSPCIPSGEASFECKSRQAQTALQIWLELGQNAHTPSTVFKDQQVQEALVLSSMASIEEPEVGSMDKRSFSESTHFPEITGEGVSDCRDFKRAKVDSSEGIAATFP